MCKSHLQDGLRLIGAMYSTRSGARPVFVVPAGVAGQFYLTLRKIKMGNFRSLKLTINYFLYTSTGSIQGSDRPISFIRIKHRTRADVILCKTEY